MLDTAPPVTREMMFCVFALARNDAVSPVPRLNVPKLWKIFVPTVFPIDGVI